MKKQAEKAFVLIAILIIALCACGKEERQRGIDGYVYEAELVQNTENWGNHLKVSGNWLYYEYGSSLYRVPVGEDGTFQGAGAEKLSVGEGIVDYALDAEGNLYCYKPALNWSDSGYVELSGGTLERYREDGSQDFRVSLDGRSGMYAYLSTEPGFLAVGSPEQIFLQIGDTVLVIDAAGKIIGEADINASRPAEGSFGEEKLMEGGGGRIYYLSENTVPQSVYELVKTGDSWQLKTLAGSWSNRQGRFQGSSEGILYSGLEGILQRYDPEEGKWQDVLNWSDSNLSRDVQELVWVSNEKMLTSRSVNTDKKQEREFYLLRKKYAEDLPQREELVLACQGICSDSLEDSVLLFNRASEKYHITIQVYEGEDAFSRLDAELVSSAPPDLLDLSGLDVAKYGGKQALEDLLPYLEGSASLQPEDFLEGILDGYTVGGRLVGIPSSFICHTLLGNTSEVGEHPGWKMEDMVWLTESYPGRKLNGRSFYRNLDTVCGAYIMERFVDREKGKCDFDSEEFCRLMVWLAEHSGKGSDYYASEEVEDALIFVEEVGGITDYLGSISRFGEEMTVMGYPSADGMPRHQAWTYNAIGITAKSQNKEGAWQFIEYFLSQGLEETGLEQAYLPARRDLLEKLLEEAMTPEYQTVNGEVLLDEEGNPVEKAKWEIVYDGGREVIKYGCLSEEEAEGLLDLIEHTDFTPEGGLKSEVMTIIGEEMDSYFSGDKTMEDVAALIQNRVNTLVQENL